MQDILGNSVMPQTRVFISGVVFAAAALIVLLLPTMPPGGDGAYYYHWLLSSTFVFCLLIVHLANHGSIVEPATLLFVFWAIRFFLPAATFSASDIPDPTLEWIGMIHADDFYIAGMAANSGVLAVYSGWCFALAFSRRHFKVPEMSRATKAKIGRLSFAATVVGVISLVAFVAANGSFWQLLLDGGMRSVEVQGGTGLLFRIALMAIPGSVIYAFYEYERSGRLTISAVAFPLVVFVAFAILGGRIRALLPLGAFAIAVMMISGNDRLTLRSALALVLMLTAFGGTLTALNIYRQAGGVSALATVTGQDQVQSLVASLPSELGQLQGVYIPLRFGENSLRGGTYKVLLFPFNNLLGMESRNTGVLIRDLATGPNENQWGFHPSMIGDAILNFGRWFMLVKCLAIGWLLGMLRNVTTVRRLAVPMYVLLSLYLLRAFFESTDKVQEIYMIAFFSLLIYWPVWARSIMKRSRVAG